MHGYDFTALMRRLNVDVTNSNQVLPKIQYRQEIARTPTDAYLSRSSKPRGRGSSARPARGVSARSGGHDALLLNEPSSSSTALVVSQEVAPLSGPFKQRLVRPVSAPASAVQRSQKVPSSTHRAVDAHDGEDEPSGRLERYLLSKRREELAAAEEEGREVSPLRSRGGRSSREKAVGQARVGARPTTPMMKATYEARAEIPSNTVHGLTSMDNFEALPAGSEIPFTEALQRGKQYHEHTLTKDAPGQNSSTIKTNHMVVAAGNALNSTVEISIEQPMAEQVPCKKLIGQASVGSSLHRPDMIQTEFATDNAEAPCSSLAGKLPWSASSPGGNLSGNRINASAPLTPSSGGKSLDFLVAQAAEQEAAEMQGGRKIASVPLVEERDKDEIDDANSVDLRAAIMDAESLAAAAEAQARAAREEVARLCTAIARTKAKPERGAAASQEKEAYPRPTPEISPAPSATENPADRVKLETQTSALNNDVIVSGHVDDSCESQQPDTATDIGLERTDLVASVFRTHDWNNSGNLDVFELASAVAEIWGKPPSTAQVSAMVHASDATATNALTLQQFSDLLSKDWPEDDA